MKRMPHIGDRVIYRSRRHGDRTVTGTVAAQYPEFPGGPPDAAGVRVDTIPDWWPYPDTDGFAPDIAELSHITTGE